jgi:hypothetical protein
MQPKELKILPQAILIKSFMHAKFQVKIRILSFLLYKIAVVPLRIMEKTQNSNFDLKLCIHEGLDENSLW